MLADLDRLLSAATRSLSGIHLNVRDEPAAVTESYIGKVNCVFV